MLLPPCNTTPLYIHRYAALFLYLSVYFTLGVMTIATANATDSVALTKTFGHTTFIPTAYICTLWMDIILCVRRPCATFHACVFFLFRMNIYFNMVRLPPSLVPPMNAAQRYETIEQTPHITPNSINFK